ncbi:MAG: hypothetical protein PVI97_00665 [Candidatus Thiodiazotropha sp.]
MTQVKNITDHPICARNGMIRPGERAEVDQEYLDWFVSKGWVEVSQAEVPSAPVDENVGDEPSFLD